MCVSTYYVCSVSHAHTMRGFHVSEERGEIVVGLSEEIVFGLRLVAAPREALGLPRHTRGSPGRPGIGRVSPARVQTGKVWVRRCWWR